jgi:hypothetical protein
MYSIVLQFKNFFAPAAARVTKSMQYKAVADDSSFQGLCWMKDKESFTLVTSATIRKYSLFLPTDLAGYSR